MLFIISHFVCMLSGPGRMSEKVLHEKSFLFFLYKSFCTTIWNQTYSVFCFWQPRKKLDHEWVFIWIFLWCFRFPLHFCTAWNQKISYLGYKIMLSCSSPGLVIYRIIACLLLWVSTFCCVINMRHIYIFAWHEFVDELFCWSWAYCLYSVQTQKYINYIL